MKKKEAIKDAHSWKADMEVVNYMKRYSKISTSMGIGKIERMTPTQLSVRFGVYTKKYYREDGRPCGGGRNWDDSMLKPATEAHANEMKLFREKITRDNDEHNAHQNRQKELVASLPNASASIPQGEGQIEIRLWFNSEQEAREAVERLAAVAL